MKPIIPFVYFKNQVKALVTKAYEAGIEKGFKAGYVVGKVEATNKGAILGGVRISEEVEQILKEKDF